VNKQGGSGGGESRPLDPSEQETEIVLHEEEASVGRRWEGVGYARVRREVEHEKIRSKVPRQRERLIEERVPAAQDDSGKIETLPDGSVSIPLYEEELVVTRKTVLRERVVIRKENVTEWQRVEAELRRERVRFETDDVPEGSVRGALAARRPRSAITHLAETRPFFLTSEFVLAFAAWLALLLTTVASDSLGAQMFWLLTILIVAGYMLSRGAAKSRTPCHAVDPREHWR
jgi:uncharacterized protein (TIGR02271 family)